MIIVLKTDFSVPYFLYTWKKCAFGMSDSVKLKCFPEVLFGLAMLYGK